MSKKTKNRQALIDFERAKEILGELDQSVSKIKKKHGLNIEELLYVLRSFDDIMIERRKEEIRRALRLVEGGEDEDDDDYVDEVEVGNVEDDIEYSSRGVR